MILKYKRLQKLHSKLPLLADKQDQFSTYLTPFPAWSIVKSGFVSRNLVKFAIVQIIGKLWKGVIYSRLSPFSVQEIPDPIIEYPNEVIVKNLLSGICGTDMALLQAKVDLRVAPAALSRYDRMYLGHENLAKVKQVGDKVDGFEIGDRVTVVKLSALSEFH